jgi:integrase/recombinase XerD
MLLRHAVEEMFLAKDYTPASIRRRREVFDDFIGWAERGGMSDLSQLSRTAIRRYFRDVTERPNRKNGGNLASATQHTHAAYVRALLRWCADEGWLGDEVVRNFAMPHVEKKVVQVLTYRHFELLMHAADKGFMEALHTRDKAILSLMLDTGLRAMEVCSLRLDDVSISPQESFVRVHGKGRKQREVGLGKQSKRAMRRYELNGRPKSESPLFFLDRAGKTLTPNAIDRMLYRLRDVAGRKQFDGIRVSAHTLRHSFAVHYMQQGSGDIYKLSRLLGHENVSTTERYLRAFQARDARKTSRSVLDGMS